MQTENWELAYQRGETQWDHGTASPALLAELAQRPLRGQVIVIGCGTGHDVAALAELGLDVTGLDVAPTALEKARRQYPQHAQRFVQANLFELPTEMFHRFDVVVEHTCLSGMPPEMRPQYANGVRHLLKPGGLIIGVWYIEPDLDPGESGPPFPLPVAELDRLFDGEGEILADYVPTVGYAGRIGRERVRVIRLGHTTA